MSTAEQPKFVSVDDYLASEETAITKSEYIDGWVRAMAGANVRHNMIKMNCGVYLGGSLKGQRCRPFDSDMKVRIRRNKSERFYYPDLHVVCESSDPTDVFQDNPILIVEVLSQSTRAYDLDEKLAAYLTIPSLECYLILEQHIPFAIVIVLVLCPLMGMQFPYRDFCTMNRTSLPIRSIERVSQPIDWFIASRPIPAMGVIADCPPTILGETKT